MRATAIFEKSCTDLANEYNLTKSITIEYISDNIQFQMLHHFVTSSVYTRWFYKYHSKPSATER